MDNTINRRFQDSKRRFENWFLIGLGQGLIFRELNKVGLDKSEI